MSDDDERSQDPPVRRGKYSARVELPEPEAIETPQTQSEAANTEPIETQAETPVETAYVAPRPLTEQNPIKPRETLKSDVEPEIGGRYSRFKRARVEVGDPRNEAQRSFRNYLIVVVALFALGVGSCVVFSTSILNALRSPVDVTNSFMSAYRSGKSVKDLQCVNTDPSGDLVTRSIPASKVRSYRFGSAQTNGGNASLSGAIIDKNGVGHPIAVSLSKDGGWKVCSFTTVSSSSRP